MQISRTTANTIHILAIVVQVLNPIVGIVPPKYQTVVAAIVGGLQLYIGQLQHNSMPPQ